MEKHRKALILIVDDNHLNLKILADLAEDEGHEAVLAVNGTDALDFVRQELPDIVLLDIMMPDIDGYEVCRRLKQKDMTKDIPVIFLTAKAETEDIVKGFEVGGVDYLTKPFNTLELKARLKTHLALKWARDDLKQYNKQLKKANEFITRQNDQLKQVMKALELASVTDSLTGLYNRRYITSKIEEEVSRFKRNRKSFSIVIGDIDFFKRVNDSYGHACGDYVLREVSQVLQQLIREQDFISRWGGEEFLIMLPETGLDGAAATAERLRSGIEQHKYRYQQAHLLITMTFGVSVYDEEKTVDKVILEADNALYQGKAEGRNRVVLATGADSTVDVWEYSDGGLF
jgi:diguanylate cyclase (GGDEF)-like protein